MGSTPQTPQLDWSPIPGRPSGRVQAGPTLVEGDLIGARYEVTDDPPIIGGYGVVYTLFRADGGPNFIGKVPKYPIIPEHKIDFENSWRSEAARTLAIPIHPNLIEPVWVESQTRAGPMLISKKIHGVTLDTVIASKSLSMSDRLLLALEVLLGMEFHHTCTRKPHLDLSPRNIVYGTLKLVEHDQDHPSSFPSDFYKIALSGPRAILIDFGFSTELLSYFPKVETDGIASFDDIDPRSITYWSPDHLSASGTLSARSDIYSFGILLFELLTWSLPFKPSSVNAIIKFQKEPTLRWPNKIEDVYLHEFRSIAASCLQKQSHGLRTFSVWSDLVDYYFNTLIDFFEKHGNIAACDRAREARAQARTTINYWSQSATVMLAKTEAVASLGEYNSALAAVKQITDVIGWSPRAGNILAACYLKTGNRNAAIAEYNRLLAEEPSNGGARTTRGSLRLTDGDTEGAFQDFRITLRIHPDSVSTLLLMAEACRLTNRLVAAVGAWWRAMPLSTVNRPAIAQRLSEICVAAGWPAITPEIAKIGEAHLLKEIRIENNTACDDDGDSFFFDEHFLKTSIERLPSTCSYLIAYGSKLAAIGDDYIITISSQFAISDPLPHNSGTYVCGDFEAGTLATWHEDSHSIDVLCGTNNFRIDSLTDLFENRDDIDCAAIRRCDETLFIAYRFKPTNLVAIDFAGHPRWKATVPGRAQTILATEDETTRVCLIVGTKTEVFAFGEDGDRLWQFTPRFYTGAEAFLGPDRISILAHIKEWDAFIICSTVASTRSYNHLDDIITLYCVDSNGVVRWMAHPPYKIHKAVYMSGNRVALSCSTDKPDQERDLIIAIDAIGRLCWAKPVDDWIVGMFFDKTTRVLTALCKQGECYFVGLDGVAHGDIRLPVEDISQAGCVEDKVVFTSGTNLYLLEGVGQPKLPDDEQRA
jgi:tetratricopeptide (TPR) repeat protein